MTTNDTDTSYPKTVADALDDLAKRYQRELEELFANFTKEAGKLSSEGDAVSLLVARRKFDYAVEDLHTDHYRRVHEFYLSLQEEE